MNLDQSIKQVLNASDVFGELFYEEFFRRCPEAKPFFGDADMVGETISEALAKGLDGITVDLPVNGHLTERVSLLGEIANKALG